MMVVRNKVSHGEYLAFLSVKYEVDPDKLFRGLISAEKERKSACGNLSIEYRGNQKSKSIFLLTNGSKVAAQFSIPKDFLLEKPNPIKNLRKAVMLRRHLPRQNRGSHFFHIKDLQVGMKQINLKAKVLKISEPTLVFTRFGNYASVANALIADETGTIKLCLWNEQIETMSTGSTIQIENANVSAFRGEKQLRIGKKGRLESRVPTGSGPMMNTTK
jgi:replication factor A1